MMKFFGIEFKSLAVVLGILFVASYGFSAEEDSVNGKVIYMPAAGLSDSARVEVSLVNKSSDSVQNKVISEAVLPASGEGSVDFSLSYHPSDIDPQDTYIVQARIIDAGELTFVNTTTHMVLTNGYSESVDLELKHLKSGSVVN